MPSTRTYRTHAIALKSNSFAERDRLLVLFTPNHGKLRVLAKGVRRISSRLSGHVGLFSHSNLFLVNGRTFDLVTQGETIEQFPLLREDLWRLSQAFYAGELVDRFTEDQHPVTGLFEALVCCLSRLNDASLDPTLVIRAFELELLGLTGYRPQLYRCISCNCEIQPASNGFSYTDGGVICPECLLTNPAAFSVSVEALRVLRNLQTRPEETIRKLRASTDTVEEAERVLIGYIQYLLDIRLRSVGFLDIVRNLRAMPEGSGLLG
ncbi:MAG: recO [Chloroflexi bacterium]|nr:recO [Chloroflexota bacterium]